MGFTRQNKYNIMQTGGRADRTSWRMGKTLGISEIPNKLTLNGESTMCMCEFFFFCSLRGKCDKKNIRECTDDKIPYGIKVC